MKKVLIVLLVLILVLVGGAAAVGFLADDKFDHRDTYVIDAPVAKVWAIVGDPSRAKEWLPKEGHGGIAEVRRNSPKEGQHVYVQGDGSMLTLDVVDRVENQKYLERVVGNTAGMEKVFVEVTWGWELADNGDGKTKATTVMFGQSTKPMGTLMGKVMGVMGGHKKYTEKMAKNVEAVAKGQKAPN